MNERRLARINEVVKNRQSNIIVVLEDIHDPHNAAAILRTCDAMGIQDVWFIFEKEKPYNPKRVGKATSSSANKWLTFRTFTSAAACIVALKKQKYIIMVTALNDASVSLKNYQDNLKPLAIVVSNEHSGVSDAMLSSSDIILKIPMQGFVQSMNVSVAAAIVLWEITKQRIFTDTPMTIKGRAQQKLLDEFLERSKK